MDRDEKKKWLFRYRELFFKAESLWRQAREWQEMIFNPGCKVLDGMPKAPGTSNKFDKNIIKHMDLVEEAAETSALAKKTRREIADAIDTINDALGVKVLTLRYIEGLTWNEIRSIMHYSKTHVTRIHNNALDELNLGD